MLQPFAPCIWFHDMPTRTLNDREEIRKPRWIIGGWATNQSCPKLWGTWKGQLSWSVCCNYNHPLFRWTFLFIPQYPDHQSVGIGDLFRIADVKFPRSFRQTATTVCKWSAVHTNRMQICTPSQLSYALSLLCEAGSCGNLYWGRILSSGVATLYLVNCCVTLVQTFATDRGQDRWRWTSRLSSDLTRAVSSSSDPSQGCNWTSIGTDSISAAIAAQLIL